MDIQTLSVTASEMGLVLGGLSDRRVRQLAEQGIIPRAGRGKFPLVEGVAGYLAMIEASADDADMKATILRLRRAQAIRVELQNERAEATAEELSGQEAAVSVFAIHYHLLVRRVADWLHQKLFQQGYDDATEIAGEVLNWIIACRAECEDQTRAALASARRRGHVIRTYDDLMRCLGRDPIGYDDGEATPKRANSKRKAKR